MKNRTAVWVQHGFKCVGCFPLWSCGWLGAVAHSYCPASWEMMGWYIVSWEKIQIQNSKSGFYWMSIIFPCWKIIKSNHWRSGSMWKVSALYLPTQMAYLSSFSRTKGLLKVHSSCYLFTNQIILKWQYFSFSTTFTSHRLLAFLLCFQNLRVIF